MAARSKKKTNVYFDTLESGPKGGRPKLQLNALGIETVTKLSTMQCSIEEIAAFLSVDTDTLTKAPHNRAVFREAYNKGLNKGRTAVRSALFANIKNGNTASVIFACKAILGMSDTAPPSADTSILSGFSESIDRMAEEDDGSDDEEDTE